MLYNRSLYISFITQLELLGYPYITPKEEWQVKNFIKDCIVIDINNQIKKEVIDIKRDSNIKLPDGIILGTSMYLNIPVISSDKDFEYVEGINVVFYDKS